MGYLQGESLTIYSVGMTCHKPINPRDTRRIIYNPTGD